MSGDVAADTETWAAATLAANPGSQRLAENVILLDSTFMVARPLEGPASLLGADACGLGWLCGWWHADFYGCMFGVIQGAYVDFNEWWFNIYNCETRRQSTSPEPGYAWDNWSQDISSVYNHLNGIYQAPFYDPFQRRNYYALPWPINYVGDAWNDHFTAACACG